MKTIDVRKQPKLSAHRTFEICLNGIRYRLFRSLVTVIVIGVAIAFLMNILCEALGTRSVAAVAKSRTGERRLAALWTARLTVVDTPDAILREVARAGADDPLLAEARAMSGLDEAAFAAYRERATAAAAYLDFFDGLDYGSRRQLVRTATGVAVFDVLQDAQAYAAFAAKLAMLKIRLPKAAGDFPAFLKEWPDLRTTTETIHAARATAVATIGASLQGRSVDEALVEADGAFGETIRQAGFTGFDAGTAAVVARQARQLQEVRTVERTIERNEMRALVAAELDLLPGDINAILLWKVLRNQGRAVWYLGKLKEKGIDVGSMSPARVVELAREKAQDAALDRALQNTTEASGGFLGIGGRMSWLVLISLLVCVVGISNAMLMSVTERFREIATLKCLGALDGFIMMLFVMEASLLGLVGGVIGGLAGSLIGFGRMFAAFGNVFSMAFPAGPWLSALGISLLIGMLLAALAGVYPSYIAARLAPMEAMRIE